MLSTEADALADVTALLRELTIGRADGLPLLFAQVQGDLRRVAHRERLAVQAGETLSTTALINEAYLKLDKAQLPPFVDRRHFYNVAARAMRQVLVDYARTKLSAKRGGGAAVQALDAVTDPGDDPADAARLLEINDALDHLETIRPRLAQVVYLRFYAGLSDREIGDLLDVEESTVRRDWLKARGWLFQALQPS
jgi:RNA polymerase sigma factor (TIGR02999 family)